MAPFQGTVKIPEYFIRYKVKIYHATLIIFDLFSEDPVGTQILPRLSFIGSNVSNPLGKEIREGPKQLSSSQDSPIQEAR